MEKREYDPKASCDSGQLALYYRGLSQMTENRGGWLWDNLEKDIILRYFALSFACVVFLPACEATFL